MSSIKGNPASITWSHMRWSVGVWMKGIFKIIGFSKSLWQSPTQKIIKETKLSWAWRKVSFMDQKLVRKQKVWRWRKASTEPPGIHVHEDFIQYLHHRPGEKRNREISEPADETKSFWVVKWHNNGEEHQQKAKKPSGQGGGSWASLDKLKGNTYRDNNLNHDGDAELMGVTTSDLGVITDSYLKSSAHCAVASKKRINKMLWIIWRDAVKGTGVVLQLHKPLACPHPVCSPGLRKVAAVRQGQLIQWRGWSYHLAQGESTRAQATQPGGRKLKSVCCFKVYKKHGCSG